MRARSLRACYNLTYLELLCKRNMISKFDISNGPKLMTDLVQAYSFFVAKILSKVCLREFYFSI